MSLTTIGWTGTPLTRDLVLARDVRLDGDTMLRAGTYPLGHVLPGFTFNPWIGCQRISEACEGCYAEELVTGRMGYNIESADPRRRLNLWGPPSTTDRQRTAEDNWKRPLRWNKLAADLGVRLKVFCASLADVFEDAPHVRPWRRELFALIDRTPALDWLLLTKRPGRVTAEVPSSWRNDLGGAWPDHVWLGATVENNKRARERIPYLLDVPGVPVRFLSVEPLEDPALDLARYLGPLECLDDGCPCGGTGEYLGHAAGCVYDHCALAGGIHDCDGQVVRCGPSIDWVIVGGRSGTGWTPLPYPAVTKLVADCDANGVKVFVKQDGAHRPGQRGKLPDALWARKGWPL